MLTPSSLYVLTFFFGLIGAQADIFPTAHLNTTWIATTSDLNYIQFDLAGANVSVIPVLLRGHSGLSFACGFYSQAFAESYVFAIFIVQTDQRSIINANMAPALVWSANWNRPVGNQVTLELTEGGDLVLKDADGFVAWSTQTSGKSVAGINLTDTGNLVMFDENDAVVWESFDDPKDTPLPGQKLRVGQTLIPSDSAYLKFESDGHLRAYQQRQNGWSTTHDVLTDPSGKCGYQMACGPYGICGADGNCSCPDRYFKPIDDSNPRFGCAEVVPLSCEASRFQSFLRYGQSNYSSNEGGDISRGIVGLGLMYEESCREACAKNCSCRAAVFFSEEGPTEIPGACFLVFRVFSILQLSGPYVGTVFIKVQNSSAGIQIPPSEPPDYPSTDKPHVFSINSKMAHVIMILIIGSSLRSFLFFIFLSVVKKCLFRNKGVREDGEEKSIGETEEDYLDQILGAPKRFNYDDLKIITEDFNKRLGEGGFGSVYEGTLANGTKVAVKHLKVLSQTKISFIAEVETVGNIQHVNLVRLVGFCAEKFHRLLVYEYMSKGSLDKWIFQKSDESLMLDWQQRRKIISDIAKGLCYLHEQCIQKIVHMDIKPQNIFLDENFNAKVADFGLSKLIDRDQSQILTTIRGTPGYLAPEWLHTSITEKVDVYSFGVVILETVCGRKVLKESQNEEDMHLLGVFKRKNEEGRLSDIIDKNSEDMQLNQPHVIDMMRLAAWCLQVDFKKRPSMSTIIRVLEGVVEVPSDLNYNFPYPTFMNDSVRIGQEDVEFGATISAVPSILSGPR